MSHCQCRKHAQNIENKRRIGLHQALEHEHSHHPHEFVFIREFLASILNEGGAVLKAFVLDIFSKVLNSQNMMSS